MHALGTCPGCGAGVALADSAGGTVTCPNCSTSLTLKRVTGTYGEHVHCDDSCLYARGPACVCHCGGDQHGMGYVNWTWVPEWVKARNAADHARKSARREAKATEARTTAERGRDRLLAAHPTLAWLTEADNAETSGFLSDMAAALAKGSMTDRQVEVAERVIAETVERASARAAREAAAETAREAGVAVPEGKVDVEGRVVSVKVETSRFGGRERSTRKMLARADDGWAVWTTIPRSLVDAGMAEQDARRARGEEWIGWADLLRGRRVRFTATLTRSDDDPLFGFAARPVGSALVEPVPA